MAIVTSAPPGMRDFLPAAVARRRFVMERIREVYRLHGFVPLETPSKCSSASTERRATS